MKALLIDPFLQGIAEIDISGDLNSLYKAIDCDTITPLVLDADADSNEREVMFLDDIGLERPGQRFFLWADYAQPLGGRGVVLGIDHKGDNTDTTVALAQARAAVRWVDVEFTHYTFDERNDEIFGKPASHIIMTANFRLRK